MALSAWGVWALRHWRKKQGSSRPGGALHP